MNTFDSATAAMSLNNAFLFNVNNGQATTTATAAANALNAQIKFELEQHNLIKMQQYEAIRLIQMSVEKLSSTMTVPLLIPQPAHTKSDKTKVTSSTSSSSPSQSSILVYKETNLHKNLLVNKILNKAKFYYYQSIVQAMRLSLISKLNYYSTLIGQLNAVQDEKKKKKKTTTTTASTNGSDANGLSYDEASIIEEMKILMQQIWQETYQFNLTNQTASILPDQHNASQQQQQQQQQQPRDNALSAQCLPVDTAASTASSTHDENSLPKEKNVKRSDKIDADSHATQSDEASVPASSQAKRIEQLNVMKLSFYSLLFNRDDETANATKSQDANANDDNAHDHDDNNDHNDSSTSSKSNAIIKHVLNETQNSLSLDTADDKSKRGVVKRKRSESRHSERKRLSTVNKTTLNDEIGQNDECCRDNQLETSLDTLDLNNNNLVVDDNNNLNDKSRSYDLNKEVRRHIKSSGSRLNRRHTTIAFNRCKLASNSNRLKSTSPSSMLANLSGSASSRPAHNKCISNKLANPKIMPSSPRNATTKFLNLKLLA